MNYARLNFLQLDRLQQTRMSWGALCYEIARDGGACMHFANDQHGQLVECLRRPEGIQGLEDVAGAILRGLNPSDDAEDLTLDLESLVGTARVLSPVAVKSIGADLGRLDDRRLQALLDRTHSLPEAAASGAGGLHEAIRGLIDFYRRAATRGQYLLIAELAH